jgi:TRAP-type C4-dicarboxylate transport system permease large subunit
MVTGLGFDGIWFAVVMVLAVNIGLLTPPLGVSVFVIKGVARDIPLQVIFRGAVPMVIAMVVCLLLVIAFPQIVTFLPDLMRS